MLLHQPGIFPIGPHFPSPLVFVLYPLIPWIGVMAVGYTFGALYQKDAQLRKRWLLIIGGRWTSLFLFFKAIATNGQPLHWSVAPEARCTVLLFVNLNK